jgi:hypothetical protein
MIEILCNRTQAAAALNPRHSADYPRTDQCGAANPDGVVNVKGGVARDVTGCAGGVVVVVAVPPSVAVGSETTVAVPGWS